MTEQEKRPAVAKLEKHALATLKPEPTLTVGEYCRFFNIEGAQAVELLNFLEPHLQKAQATL